MKKILFMCINMNIGGTEKALLNMIDEMPRDKYKITILMLEKYGGFLENIPKDVEVKYLENYSLIKEKLNNPPLEVSKKLLKNNKVIDSIGILGNHIISKIIGERSNYFKYVLKGFKKLEDEYDVAVAYAGPMDFITYYILNEVNAKKKISMGSF